MAERYLALTALLACLPALMGNRTACALLASYLYAAALEWAGAPFWWPEWLLADAFVLAVILRPVMTLADELIAALFVVAWFGYAMNPRMNYEIGVGIVGLQFLLTLPVRKWQRVIFSVSHGSLRAGGIQEVCNGGKH